MNLDRFKSLYTVTAKSENQSASNEPAFPVPDLAPIIAELGGQTFNHGVFRVFRADQIPAAVQDMESMFPQYRGRLVPFAFDWLGRHFAMDLASGENGHPHILLLEVGVGEAMIIPVPVVEFFNVELVEYADDALAVPFWKKWRDLNPADLAFTDCVGYKVPLFLGGADVVSNLEVNDMSVYVELCGQLRTQIQKLPQGQAIGNVSIKDE
ncbi:MAG: DUF1851 domain-containing protein [Verrucomicrobia bacterium]|nr:DUF1851 domain-containing protein [Verrucomicrobiota bacterium]